jgi:hypothetical protein
MSQVYLKYITSNRGKKQVYGEYVNGYDVIPLDDVFGLTFYGAIPLKSIYVNISYLADVSSNLDKVFKNESQSYSTALGDNAHIELLRI